MQQTHEKSKELCSSEHVAKRAQHYVVSQAADVAFHQELRSESVRILPQSSGGFTKGDYALAFLSHGVLCGLDFARDEKAVANDQNVGTIRENVISQRCVTVSPFRFLLTILAR
jgi:hypothetical protein